MKKKINIFLNGVYVCSSFKYRTCKEAAQTIKEKGFLEWAGIEHQTTGKLDFKKLCPSDTVKARFAK